MNKLFIESQQKRSDALRNRAMLSMQKTSNPQSVDKTSNPQSVDKSFSQTLIETAAIVPPYHVALSVLSAPKRKQPDSSQDEFDVRLTAIEIRGRSGVSAIREIASNLANGNWFAELLAKFPREHVIDYARFLLLKIKEDDYEPPFKLSPSGPVDAVWHAHMLLPQDYFTMITTVLPAGKFLHHNPSTASEADRAERYLRTRQLYKITFVHDLDANIWPREEIRGPNVQARILKVVTLTGIIIIIPFSENMTIYDLKRGIQIKEDFPPEQQRLIYAGYVLGLEPPCSGMPGPPPQYDPAWDSAKLKDLEFPVGKRIESGSTIHLVLKLGGC